MLFLFFFAHFLCCPFSKQRITFSTLFRFPAFRFAVLRAYVFLFVNGFNVRLPSSSSSIPFGWYISQPNLFLHFMCIFMAPHSERKFAFMKCLRKLFKAGFVRRGNSQHPRLLDDEDTIWRTPTSSLDHRSKGKKEMEDLDRATAIALGENMKRPNDNSSLGWPIDCDEELARALQDDTNSSSLPLVPKDFYRLCDGCHGVIDYGHYLGCMGRYFHPYCFCCHSCGYPITENEFSQSGKDLYHKSCFKELTHPKCDVCHQFIPLNVCGLIEYRCHPFWSQKYCPSHEHDQTTRCCSCERLESWKTRHYSLDDRRSLCLECLESAIMDTGDCQPLYHSIRDYYEGLNMRLDQQIPMLLVEREALNEAVNGEKNGYHHMPETRGLCLSEEQTITSIIKKPKFGDRCFVGMRTHLQKLTRICEVTAILVLYGLPRLLTGAILAHELMHGWLRLKGYRNLDPEIEEGICQVLSYMWLESEVLPYHEITFISSLVSSFSSSSSSKKGMKSNAENKLGEFFMHQIAHDSSQAYGSGFRVANAAVNKYGLHSTLDHIRLTGNFPL